MRKNILITTGGSGGHVIPATIICEHLKDQHNIHLTSDQRGIKFLNKDKFNIEIVDTPKLSKNIFLLPYQIILFINSIIKSFIILKKKKIEIVISTGGYMSLPLCFASTILNRKLFLIEPNMVLGRSNKIFIKHCNKIFCYSNKIKNFPNKFKNKISIIYPLVRKEFYEIQKVEKTSDKVNILIIGGSQGAKLFDTIIHSIKEISKKYKLKIYQQTNADNFKKLKDYYSTNSIENELFDFNRNISNIMNESSFCITRAGASTLAELIFMNIPHLTIPLPTSKDNHQFENANFYQQYGCNWIMNQNEINETNLTSRLIHIIQDKEEYFEKKKNMKNFNFQNSWNNVNQKIIDTINEN
jgi:UDP-N-acetylglucosamine--N-acetylmuramyl-(pentapeptide) pyrophosphoryl-undecaprenol N-acetylglucosamine transferase